MMKTTALNTRELTIIGLMTAVMCILGPIAMPIPFSPVPISFGNLAIFLALYVLGMKQGFISYLVYFFLGLAGLPVFTGFSGGLGKALGPTGGYLIGFFFMVVIAGFFIDRWPGKKTMSVAGMFLGSLVCNIFGTIWLSYQLGISFVSGLGVGVLPYLPGDLIKIICASIIGPTLRRAVRNL